MNAILEDSYVKVDQQADAPTAQAQVVLDAEGKLHSTEAQGKLDAILPKLLKKASASDDGAERRDP